MNNRICDFEHCTNKAEGDLTLSFNKFTRFTIVACQKCANRYNNGNAVVATLETKGLKHECRHIRFSEVNVSTNLEVKVK